MKVIHHIGCNKDWCDITDAHNHCECGEAIAATEDLCGECACEDDSE